MLNLEIPSLLAGSLLTTLRMVSVGEYDSHFYDFFVHIMANLMASMWSMLGNEENAWTKVERRTDGKVRSRHERATATNQENSYR
jgi:hypothetical protein